MTTFVYNTFIYPDGFVVVFGENTYVFVGAADIFHDNGDALVLNNGADNTAHVVLHTSVTTGELGGAGIQTDGDDLITISSSGLVFGDRVADNGQVLTLMAVTTP